jgi:hypothetical protein
MSNPEIKHLLIKGEYRVWCRPDKSVGVKMVVTSLPSKASCANCLTRFRRGTTDNKAPFRVSWTERPYGNHL